jgi:two-component system response regulator
LAGRFVLEETVDGPSALNLMESFRPDFVLCDIGMKPMGGFEFVEALRRNEGEKPRGTRVIILTAECWRRTRARQPSGRPRAK